jgi:predicted nucleic acid-binding protein
LTEVLVDTNVLLDVITNDPNWGDWSRSTLRRVANEAILVINPIIYAEVSTNIATIEAVEEALPEALYRRHGVPYEAAFLAGKAFLEYKRRGGPRRSPLPDFYIGAHAAVLGYRLLTRDTSRFRTYFPTVELIAPPSENGSASR